MLTHGDLDSLEALAREATPGPWHVRFLDDDHAMTAIGISAQRDTGEHADMGTFGHPGPDLVAACLIQAPPYVVPAYGKSGENARLIAAMRNALPELVRLARIGMRSERGA